MKLGRFLVLMIAGILFFASCDRTDDTVSLIRIETESVFVDGTLSNFSSYFYDDLGRLVGTTFLPGSDSAYTIDTVIYLDNMIIDSSFVNENDTPNVYRSYLNSRGFVDSVEYSYKNVIFSSGGFEYDNEGYLISENSYSKNYGIDYQFSAKYIIQNGNRTRAIYNRIYDLPNPSAALAFVKSRYFSGPTIFSRFNDIEGKKYLQGLLKIPRQKIVNEKYEYKDTTFYEYTDTLNNISSVNRGITWDGTQNKNLVSKQTIQSNGEYIYNYSYVFDGQNRVLRQSALGPAEYLTKYTYSSQTFTK